MRNALAKVALTALLLGALLPVHSYGAQLGTSCKKVGAKSGGLVCKTVGSKKLWSKASKKSSKKVEPSRPVGFSSPDLAEVGLPCLTYGTTAVTLQGAVRCENKWILIPKESDTVESRAYRYLLEEYLAQPESELSIIFRIDPATPAWKNKIQKGMMAGARLWGTSPSGSTPRYVYMSTDENWLFSKFQEDGVIQDPARRFEMFRGPCNAGFSGSGNDDSVFWFYKFQDANCFSGAGFYQVPAHEYTHYAQFVLTKSRFFNFQKGNPKKIPWLDEGLASYVGSALGPMSDMPYNIRSMTVSDLNRTTVTRLELRPLGFFSTYGPEVEFDPRWGDVYTVGEIAVEGMIAILGFKKIKEIFTEIGTPNSTYEDALVKVTGLGSAAWVEILQGYVTSVKGSKDWTLDYLLAEYQRKRG